MTSTLYNGKVRYCWFEENMTGEMQVWIDWKNLVSVENMNFDNFSEFILMSEFHLFVCS